MIVTYIKVVPKSSIMVPEFVPLQSDMEEVAILEVWYFLVGHITVFNVVIVRQTILLHTNIPASILMVNMQFPLASVILVVMVAPRLSLHQTNDNIVIPIG